MISAVLSTLFMPVCGAIVDYTPHRKLVGIVTAAILIVLELVQIGTTEQTWLAMGIIQAMKGFIFQLQIVVVFAYMPDIARQVDATTMTKFSSQISAGQYVASILFLVVITVISQLAHSSAVVTSHISQGLNTCTSIVFFGIGWHTLTPRPAVRKLPDGHWLLFEGYRQNWKTAKSVQQHYKQGLRWYLIAVVFAEACTCDPKIKRNDNYSTSTDI